MEKNDTGPQNHKKDAPLKLNIGIITVSTTRTLKEDKSGLWIKDYALQMGHKIVCHLAVTDNASKISKTVKKTISKLKPDALILTGGTGIAKMDVTIEAVRKMFKKELFGFSAIFAQLSFKEIGSAAILSRTSAGIIGNTFLACIPGSIDACRLACSQLIFPELSHIAKHIREN